MILSKTFLFSVSSLVSYKNDLPSVVFLLQAIIAEHVSFVSQADTSRFPFLNCVLYIL